jgi:uncharacterized protein
MSNTAHPESLRRRAPRCAWLVLCMGVLALCTRPADALGRTELYQVTVPKPDRSEASQTSAFEAALRIVVVRVTGRRGAGEDSALAPLISEARRYVQQYRATPDNQLWVTFDGTAIDRWLAQNGQPIWGHDRPTTFVWLALPPAGTQPAAVAHADDTSDAKAAIDAEALARGIPLRWPTAAELQAHHIDYAAVTGSATASLVDLGQRLGAEAVLIGRPTVLGGVATIHWLHQFQEHSAEYTGPVDGIDGAADMYAGLFAASGAPTSVDIEVGGLVDVRAYARLQGYLESLSFVSHVSLRTMNADKALFRLTVRGGSGALQRAIAGNPSLEALPAVDASFLRFQLRP